MAKKKKIETGSNGDAAAPAPKPEAAVAPVAAGPVSAPGAGPKEMARQAQRARQAAERKP